MRLALCSLCERHVQPEARECPFCGTRLGVAVWQPTVVLATMLGMALVGCGDKSGEGASADASATMSAGTSGMATDTQAGSTGVDDVPDGGGYDYDGAPPDWTTTSTTGDTETTGSTSGSESSTGTDDTGTDDTDGSDEGTTGSGG
jgi:hypothetical protein